MKSPRSHPASRSLRFLAVPPPFRAWLTISNDPDHTTWGNWLQLNQLIWQELKLPLADSFFVYNHNAALPEQVNLLDHPEILDAHAHDTMHTWGDFLQSRRAPFHRDLAVEALGLLSKLAAKPRVWTDHSRFEGNLLHRATRQAVPVTTDSAGHEYENPTYTLDLIRQAGVRYVWDGNTTRVIGQDRPIARSEHYARSTSSEVKLLLKVFADVIGQPLWRAVQAKAFDFNPGSNRQYEVHQFPDRQRYYRFRRYGAWENADIDGLAISLSEEFTDRLLHIGGTSVVYTHLGKRKVSRSADAEHVPTQSVAALTRLARLYGNRDLMISGTADLLDYMVLRDHAVVGKHIDFRPDGIRFETISHEDLSPFSFGVFSRNAGFDVRCNGERVNHHIEDFGEGRFCVSFSAA